MNESPKLIAIEGLDGAGKSEVLSFLEKKYEGKDVVFTREPGNTPLGEQIKVFARSGELNRMAGFTRLSLFCAARASHVDRVIRPAMTRKKHVICKGFAGANFAYQIFGDGNHHFRLLFDQMHEQCLMGLHPYYIYLDVDPKIGRVRKLRAQDEEFEPKPLEYYKAVRRGYHEFISMHPSVTIDTNQPLQQVQEEVAKVVERILA